MLMKNVFALLLMLLVTQVSAADNEIRNFYVENDSKVARDIEVFTVPEGKTFVLTTIYALTRNQTSVFVKKDGQTLLRFHPADDNLLNFNTGLAFPAGSSMSLNFRSNYLTLSGYLE